MFKEILLFHNVIDSVLFNVYVDTISVCLFLLKYNTYSVVSQ